MSKSYKSSAFLLAMTVAIATPVRAMENQVEVSTQQQAEAESCEQQSVLWYKKRANQVAAGIAVLAAAYALAVYMDKIGLFPAEFCPRVPDTIVPADTNNQKTNNNAPKADEPAVDSSSQIDVAKEPNFVSGAAKADGTTAEALLKVDVDNTPQFVDEKIDEIDGGNKESSIPVASSNQNIETAEISLEDKVQQKLEELKAAVALFWNTPADENPATDDLFENQYN